MKFDIITIDPPYSFGDPISMSSVPRGAASNYPVLDAAEIVKLDVKSIAADDAVLVLWVPSSLIGTGMCAMDSFGFRQTQVWVWVKTGKHEERLDPTEIQEDLQMAFGMGRLARAACEIALVGVRGSPYKNLVAKNIRNVFLAPNLGHSRKPDCVAEALEKMFPRSRPLELFARRSRAGWTCCGQGCSDTPNEDIRDSIKRLAAIPDAPLLTEPKTETHDNPFAG